MTDDKPVLKWCPEDFLVSEATATRIDPTGKGPYQYLRLRKRGYSTFDAVAAVARFAGVDRKAVTYAGLKDEDGVTDQQICFYLPDGYYPVGDFNTAHRDGTAYMHLTACGVGIEPMKIGRLDGNSFRIIIRNLDADLAEALAGRRHNHLFINYYDTQRFGLPGGPRVTHLIGARLIDGDCAAALALVATSGSSESSTARSWHGEPAAFFAGLDPRLRSFYLSAHASDSWNRDVATLIDRHGATTSHCREGIEYKFTTSRTTAATVALHTPELTYTKYRASDDGDIKASESTRSTVVQAQVVAGLAEPDDAFPGRHRCEITTFLPSGSYATTAIAQLLEHLT